MYSYCDNISEIYSSCIPIVIILVRFTKCFTFVANNVIHSTQLPLKVLCLLRGLVFKTDPIVKPFHRNGFWLRLVLPYNHENIVNQF